MFPNHQPDNHFMLEYSAMFALTNHLDTSVDMATTGFPVHVLTQLLRFPQKRNDRWTK